MKYADDRSIPYVVMIGSDEIESGNITHKHMESGEQGTESFESFLSKIK